MIGTSLVWRSTVAFTYLKVKSAKCLCLLPAVSWSWSCKQQSWSWSCYFGLVLTNLVLSIHHSSKVTLRRARLVLRWATVSGCNQPPRSTQPSILSGSVSEEWPTYWGTTVYLPPISLSVCVQCRIKTTEMSSGNSCGRSCKCLQVNGSNVLTAR